ncbi:MAG: lipoprotein [Prevotella sp.]|nr:lipoprotein [Prevotella sp.]
MKRIFFFITIILALASCQDDSRFSTSGNLRLTFSADTLKMDTVFSKTPSSTYTFWVYNQHDEGIRLNSVRLARRNQTGFRVNVDGSYLDNSNGSQVNDLEVRRKDSLLVFVELTAAENLQQEPQLLEDHLVFTLENGTEQTVDLRAWVWDAERVNMLRIQNDTVIESQKPLVVMEGIVIEEGVTLTLRNTTLYFHDQAGIDVMGSLHSENCTMRGDRLDHMFAYLPYDRVSGQWNGVRFYESSVDNQLTDTEVRNARAAIVCDSAAIDSTQARLTMTRCIVHNAEGSGIEAVNTYLILRECQLSNTLGPCLSVSGGIAEVSYCTLAQFYPFSADRGTAIYFSNSFQGQPLPLLRFSCEGSIVTGYEEDVVVGEPLDTVTVFNYQFTNTLLRTPKVETADSIYFQAIRWETPKDSIQGKKHFKIVDEDNLYYDFHLDSLSTAQGLGCYR